MVRTPEPYVYDYLVRRIKFNVVDHKIRPEWATAKPELVNTMDIEEILRKDDVFLLGWHEAYYEVEPVQVKGTIIDRATERIRYREHSVNISLILMLWENYEQALKQSGVVHTSHVRSYERILFDLGWVFRWVPVPEDGVLGAEIPRQIAEQLMRAPEIVALLEKHPTTTVLPAQSSPHPKTEESAGQPFLPEQIRQIEGRMDRIELLLEQLLDSGGNTGASANGPGSGQLRPFVSERNESSSPFEYPDEGSTDSGVPEHGSAIHKLKGIFPLG